MGTHLEFAFAGAVVSRCGATSSGREVNLSMAKLRFRASEQQKARSEVKGSRSLLTDRLIAEARLDPARLSPGQIQRFVDIAAVLESPPELIAHRSVTSKTKRLVDIVGALVGLMLGLLLAVPISLAIKMTSKGPVFFKQTRCGFGGAPFVMWKFRSMEYDPVSLTEHDNVDTGAGYDGKSASDARITRVGEFLRTTSLDELPQVLNVLRGDMSLVGTRPPTAFEVEKYDIRSWQRLRVNSGITGEWQVAGRSDIKDFERVVDLDIRYQENWSIGHDLRLLAKTLPAVLRRAGAV